MKFGKKLRAKREALLSVEWKESCVDYDTLKHYLKNEILPNSLHLKKDSLMDERSLSLKEECFSHLISRKLQALQQKTPLFVRMLDASVCRLDAFFQKETRRLCEDFNFVKQRPSETVGDGPSMQTSLNDLLQAIVRLEKFIFLNFTGICKILKKHDKTSGFQISEAYLTRLSDLAFYRSTDLSPLKLEILNLISGSSIPIFTKPLPEAASAIPAARLSPTGKLLPYGSLLNMNHQEGTGTPVESVMQFSGEMFSPEKGECNWFPPTSLLSSQKIVISMRGPHGTDIIGSLLEKIARYDVLIEDLMISRLYHNVTCAVLVKIMTEDIQLFKDLAEGASKWEAELHFEVYDDHERLPPSLDDAPYSNRMKYIATVLNQNGLTASFLCQFTTLLLQFKVSVESLRRLNDGAFCALEMKLSVPIGVDLDSFRAQAFKLGSLSCTDVALQPDDVYRRSKRLVVMDMDSTLIQQEVIDELAKHAGVVSEVAKITHRAMNGEIDFKESLKQRVGLLGGSPVDLIEKVRQNLVFTDGAHFLCKALKRLGYKLAVISGGFMPLALHVKNELGLDYAFANQLKLSPDGRTLMGETTGPIVDGERKAELLEVIAQAESVRPEQVIAIGDGANDLFMLAAAGLGIAFNAKPKVQEKAKTRINQKSLNLLGDVKNRLEILMLAGNAILDATEKQLIQKSLALDLNNSNDPIYEYDNPSWQRPRSYQQKLFEVAKERNVIAVLDTGSGKTLISVMLIKHMAALQTSSSTRKITFFLVNLVPLVFQQAAVIRSQSSLNVSHYCGEMVVDLWGLEQWRVIFERLDVIVMTAQIFLDLLAHGFLHMNQVNLLVFDECHHAKKGHPYRIIMSEFYHTASLNERPKIFAMTASPFVSNNNVQGSVRELENVLDCVALTVERKGDKELDLAAPRPTEEIVFFEPEVNISMGKLGQLLDQNIDFLTDNKSLKRLRLTAEYLCETYGTWCSEFFLRSELQNLKDELSVYDAKMATDGFVIPFKNECMLQYSPESMEIIRKLVASLKDYELPPICRTTYTDRVRRFLYLLRDARNSNCDEFRCLVFVQRRVDASVLTALIKAFPKQFFLTPIEVASIVGHGGRSRITDTEMSSKEQSKIIKQFRNGQINLLISTSVAEEGLDVRACSLVIRLELFDTLISYIQSRGRARHLNSRYVLFIENNNYKQMKFLEQVKAKEKELDYWRSDCNIMKQPDNNGTILVDDGDLADDYEISHEDLAILQPVLSETSKAKVTHAMSISLLNHYCACLPNDGFVDSRPIYTITSQDDFFVVKVTLPKNAAISEAEGLPMRQKKFAKRSAALNGIRKLYEVKAFDEHLLPKKDTPNEPVLSGNTREELIRTLEGMIRDSDICKENDLRKDISWNMQSPWFGLTLESRIRDVNRVPVYFHTFETEDPELLWGGRLHSLAVGSYSKLPELGSFPLYAPLDSNKELDYKEITVTIRTSTGPYFFTDDEHSKLIRFNSLILRYVFLRNRDYRDSCDNSPDYISEKTNYNDWNENYAYLFVPLTEQSKIDWAIIDETFENEKAFQESDELDVITIIRKLNKCKEKNFFIGTDVVDYQKRYVIEELMFDMTPDSEMSTADRFAISSTPEEGITYRKQLKKAFRRIPYTKKLLPHIKDDQPLVKLKRVPAVRNLLRPPFYDDEKPVKKMKMKLALCRIPQFIVFCVVPARLYQAASVMPSLILRLESLYSAWALRSHFPFEFIPRNLILEVLSAPSSNWGFSYQRLETLGDAFLKLSVGLHLFIKHPEKSEGQLSYARHMMVSNRILYMKASAKRLPEYILIRPINLKHFRIAMDDQPEVCLAIIGMNRFNFAEAKKLANGAHFLSDCTVADTLEALIGAAYLSGGVEAGLKMLQYFDIIDSSDLNWRSYLPLLKNLKMPSTNLPDEPIPVEVEKLGSVIGYKFSAPSLGVEAFCHPSSNYQTKCYQRLEYLGDAVLDFLVIRHLFQFNHFEHNYHTTFPRFIPPVLRLKSIMLEQFQSMKLPLDPGKLTDLKMMMVNNETLAFVSASWGLGKFMIHFSEPLFKALGSFTEYCEQVLLFDGRGSEDMTYLPWWWWYKGKNTESKTKQQFYDRPYERLDESEEEIDDDCNSVHSNEVKHFNLEIDAIPITEWHNALPRCLAKERIEPPKALSDILEACLGAIFLDSEFNLDETWQTVDRLMSITSNQRIIPDFSIVPLTETGVKEGKKVNTFDRWLHDDIGDAIYSRLHPLRKLSEWTASRRCGALSFQKLPFVKAESYLVGAGFIPNTKLDDVSAKQIDLSVIYRLEDAKSLTTINTPFRNPVVGVYIHGILFGIGTSFSEKSAKVSAVKQALVTLDLLYQNSWGIEFQDDLPVLVRGFNLEHGNECQHCSHNKCTQ